MGKVTCFIMHQTLVIIFFFLSISQFSLTFKIMSIKYTCNSVSSDKTILIWENYINLARFFNMDTLLFRCHWISLKQSLHFAFTYYPKNGTYEHINFVGYHLNIPFIVRWITSYGLSFFSFLLMPSRFPICQVGFDSNTIDVS